MVYCLCLYIVCGLHHTKGNEHMGSTLELVHHQLSSVFVISSDRNVKQAKHIQDGKMGLVAFDQCRSLKAFGTHLGLSGS